MLTVLDATPLLGVPTGVGRYVTGLLDGLVGHAASHPDDDLRLAVTAFSARRRGPLRSVPAGVAVRHRPVPARLLADRWVRGRGPGTAVVAGRADVFHGTNYLVPPGRVPAVVTVHDLAWLRHPEWVQPASRVAGDVAQAAVRAGAVVCTPSATVAGEVVEAFGADPGRVVVTPLGVDPAWAAAAREAADPDRDPDRDDGRATDAVPGLPADGRYVVAVGSAEPRKGLDVVVEAFRRLHADRADPPTLVLVGPPGWGPALDRAGLPPGAVLTPGFLPDDRLRVVVAHARALVFPSRDEGFGLPPLEAMAAGTTALASDLPVVREVTAGHATLVAAGDPDAWADALLALREPVDPGRRAAAAAHAAGSTWARCADRTVHAYRVALAGGRRTR